MEGSCLCEWIVIWKSVSVFVCVCVCVCIHVCVYLCSCMCVFMDTCVCMVADEYISLCVCVQLGSGRRVVERSMAICALMGWGDRFFSFLLNFVVGQFEGLCIIMNCNYNFNSFVKKAIPKHPNKYKNRGGSIGINGLIDKTVMTWASERTVCFLENLPEA